MLLLGRCGGCPNASSPSWVSGRVSRIMEGGENKTEESPISDLLCLFNSIVIHYFFLTKCNFGTYGCFRQETKRVTSNAWHLNITRSTPSGMQCLTSFAIGRLCRSAIGRYSGSSTRYVFFTVSCYRGTRSRAVTRHLPLISHVTTVLMILEK